MSVSRDDVRRMAALARIGLPDEQVDRLVKELGGILDHMAVLARVEPQLSGRSGEGMPLAEDAPPAVALDRARETFAPRMRDGFFLVPRLDTHDDGAGAS
jgi:aspartyl-tRNA(Asn)/glutamyl-tRNA(Gln) amidotransferase subunit C